MSKQLKKLIQQTNGYCIPQHQCVFLYWNTRQCCYGCAESNNECGGCRYAGVANENKEDWEVGLDFPTFNKVGAER